MTLGQIVGTLFAVVYGGGVWIICIGAVGFLCWIIWTAITCPPPTPEELEERKTWRAAREVEKKAMAPYQDKLTRHGRGLRRTIAHEEVYNEMNRKAFEDSVVKHLESKGSTVTRVACTPLPQHKYTDEYAGTNLVAETDNEKVVIQCAIGPRINKHGEVGAKAVKRFANEMERFPDADLFILMSSTGFTRQGRELAEAHKITLKVNTR